MYQFRDPKLHACLNKYACQVQEKNMQVVQIFYTNYMYNHLYNCSVLYKFELKVDGWQLLPTTLEMTTKPCSFNMCCFVTYTFWVEVLFEQPGIVSCLKNVCCIALESMWAIPLAQHMFDLIYVWSCKKLVKCICDFPLLKVSFLSPKPRFSLHNFVVSCVGWYACILRCCNHSLVWTYQIHICNPFFTSKSWRVSISTMYFHLCMCLDFRV